MRLVPFWMPPAWAVSVLQSVQNIDNQVTACINQGSLSESNGLEWGAEPCFH